MLKNLKYTKVTFNRLTFSILFLTFWLSNYYGFSQSLSDSLKLKDKHIVKIERKLFEKRILNEERFNLFKENLNNNVKDKFEIWSYTMEGDPIICKVKFNGKTVLLKENNRKDKHYGSFTKYFTIRKKITLDAAKNAKSPQELIDIF